MLRDFCPGDQKIPHNPMFPKPRKRFGQNFLQDPAIIDQILAAIAPQAGDRLVEIGPGRGAITQALLRQAGQLDVVELDRDLIEPLRRACQGLGQLTIHQADALTLSFVHLQVPMVMGERATPLKMKTFAITFTLTVMGRRATPLIMKDSPVTFTLREKYESSETYPTTSPPPSFSVFWTKRPVFKICT